MCFKDVSIKLMQVPRLNQNTRILFKIVRAKEEKPEKSHSPSSSSTSLIDFFTKVMFFLPSDALAEFWHARKSAYRREKNSVKKNAKAWC